MTSRTVRKAVVYGTGQSDPVLMLVLAIIQQAQADLTAGKYVVSQRDRQSAARFFRSEWYSFLMESISVYFPGVNLGPDMLPQGIYLDAEGM